MTTNEFYPIRTMSNLHILTYSITLNHNTAYEDAELYEYGIHCTLSNLCGHILEEEHIPCISSNLSLVRNISHVLANHTVYPVHLYEIVEELLSLDSIPEPDNNTTTPLRCA